MGHRALISRIEEDGTVTYNYDKSGSLEASERENIPSLRVDDSRETETAEDLRDFVLNHVDYVWHEAVWIDGDCYKPIVKGLLVKCTTSDEYYDALTVRSKVNYLENDISRHEFQSNLEMVPSSLPEHMELDDVVSQELEDFIEEYFGDYIAYNIEYLE